MVNSSETINRPTINTSEVIKAIRFPLIVLVVLAHSINENSTPMSLSMDSENAFHFVSEMLSHHLCPIGVCLFFVFSGYLFFRNVDNVHFHFDTFRNKWKKRIRSLLIPYLTWNTINIALVLLISFLYSRLGIVSSYDMMSSVRQGPWYIYFTGPIDYPLWFMRDLMILSLLTPLIWFAVKKAPYTSLFLICAFYLSCLLPAIPSYRSICFFGLGCWLGIRKIDLMKICRKVEIPALILSIILLVASTCLWERPHHELVRRFFYPFGMITALNLCGRVILYDKCKKHLFNLSETVFFIYAAHEIFILGWTKGLCLRLLGDSTSAMWAGYFLVPAIVVLVCIGLYHVMNHIAPRTLAFICGGRTEKTYQA